MIDLSWASSRLEGNTYSRLDTQNLLEFGQAAEGKDSAEAQMILNHKAAIELLVDNADDIGFDRTTLQSLHALPAEDVAAFVERTLALLLGLNEGSAGRYGLRPSEYIAWRTRVPAAGTRDGP